MVNKNLEPGYKALLVREETKKKLQAFRKSIKDRDFFQERQIATAALEYCLDKPGVMEEVVKLAKNVVKADWEQ